MREFEEVAFIKQPPLNRAPLNQLVDRPWAQSTNPATPLEIAQSLDLFLGDHPAITDQHELLDTELNTNLVDLG